MAGGALIADDYPDTTAVLVSADRLASEATLFAESGIADLLGDPKRPPIIPRGRFGAGVAAYGILAALAALVAKVKRFGRKEVAVCELAGICAWVNWKAAFAGEAGEDIRREGRQADWSVLPCLDGYVALIHADSDWPALVEMVGDKRLRDEHFSSYRSRSGHRDAYMPLIREWAARHTRAELKALFLLHELPSDAVMDERDLLTDELLLHRSTLVEVRSPEGLVCLSPRLAHRVISVGQSRWRRGEQNAGNLPLAGMRVLDLGIITAGAGVGALLADLGAEVLKIESRSYPDPFRRWGGESVSPLFKGNNRNKYAVAIDLKTEEGRKQFRQLVGSADLLLENFRRGVLDRLGFDYGTLSSINPGLILASISGQGLTGPGSEATSYGSTLEASSGFAACVCYDDGLPYITGTNLNFPDQTVVLFAAAILTLALTGPDFGMHIDISQRDATIYLNGEAVELAATGELPRRTDNGLSYLAADDNYVASAVRLSALQVERIRAQDADEAVTALRREQISAARVNAGSDLLSRFSRGDQFMRDLRGGLVKGFPFQLTDSPMSIRLNAPEVGEHTNRFVEASEP